MIGGDCSGGSWLTARLASLDHTSQTATRQYRKASEMNASPSLRPSLAQSSNRRPSPIALACCGTTTAATIVAHSTHPNLPSNSEDLNERCTSPKGDPAVPCTIVELFISYVPFARRSYICPSPCVAGEDASRQRPDTLPQPAPTTTTLYTA